MLRYFARGRSVRPADLPRDDRVARNERVERAARRVAEARSRARAKPSEYCGSPKSFSLRCARSPRLLRRADTSAWPRPSANCVAAERAGVEQVEPELEVARVCGPHGRGIDDRAHAIAVHDRKAAGVELDAVDQPRIEQADRAQEILQVERLVQPQAVEHDRGLVRLAAAHGADAGKAVGRRAGQALHGAQRLVGEPRHVLHLLLRQERVRREIAGRERDSGWSARRPLRAAIPAQVRRRRRDRRWRARGARYDGEDARSDLRQREAVRCEELRAPAPRPRVRAAQSLCADPLGTICVL